MGRLTRSDKPHQTTTMYSSHSGGSNSLKNNMKNLKNPNTLDVIRSIGIHRNPVVRNVANSASILDLRLVSGKRNLEKLY